MPNFAASSLCSLSVNFVSEFWSILQIYKQCIQKYKSSLKNIAVTTSNKKKKEIIIFIGKI